MKSQDNGTSDHLGLHDVLSLQVVVGSDEGCICPDVWKRPPVWHDTELQEGLPALATTLLDKLPPTQILDTSRKIAVFCGLARKAAVVATSCADAFLEHQAVCAARDQQA